MNETYPQSSDIADYSPKELGDLLLNIATYTDDEMVSHMLLLASDMLKVDTVDYDSTDVNQALLHDTEMRANLGAALQHAAVRQNDTSLGIIIHEAAERLSFNR